MSILREFVSFAKNPTLHIAQKPDDLRLLDIGSLFSLVFLLFLFLQVAIDQIFGLIDPRTNTVILNLYPGRFDDTGFFEILFVSIVLIAIEFFVYWNPLTSYLPDRKVGSILAIAIGLFATIVIVQENLDKALTASAAIIWMLSLVSGSKKTILRLPTDQFLVYGVSLCFALSTSVNYSEAYNNIFCTLMHLAPLFGLGLFFAFVRTNYGPELTVGLRFLSVAFIGTFSSTYEQFINNGLGWISSALLLISIFLIFILAVLSFQTWKDYCEPTSM